MAIDDQLAVLLAQNADLFATYEEWANGQIMLLAGTVDDPNSFNEAGGKTGALGYYPVINVSGQTVYVPCLARLRALALGGENAEGFEELVAQVGSKLTAVDAATTLATAKAALADEKATLAAQKAASAQTVVDSGASILAAAQNVTGVVDRTTALEQAIARLSYTGLTISAFTANPSIAEVGATIASTALAWAISGASPTVQTVTRTGGAGVAVTAGARAATVAANLTTDTTFTLVSTDGNAPAGSTAGTKTATATLRFRQKGHAGIIDKASGITSADANAMALSWWAESVTRTLATTAAAAGYLWYSQPSSQADPSAFKVNGFAVTPTKTLRNHTTATGQVVQYADFLLSNRLSAGAVMTMEIFA